MKILVFSDSHRNNDPMFAAVKNERPDMIIHLGDHYSDAMLLSRRFPEIPLTAVPGNCDFSDEPATCLLEVEGHRILLCHGHQYHVKQSLLTLTYAAKEQHAEAALFGHTHRICCDYHNGLLLFNPGSIGEPHYSGANSYGILEVTQERMLADTKIIKSMQG